MKVQESTLEMRMNGGKHGFLDFSPNSLLLASSSGRLPRGEVVSTETPGFDLPWR